VIFFVTSLGAFLASFDLSVVNIVFPSLEHAFRHDSRSSLAWVITGYSVVFGALLVTAGRVADGLGRRRLFHIGLLVFSLGSLACASAPNEIVLIAGRLVQGVGAAGILPASLGLLLETYPRERRSHMVALWGGVGALAVATGPSLGALLIVIGGWRWAFLVNLPVALMAWLLGRSVLPISRAHRTARPDLRSIFALTGSLGALVLTISQGSTWGWFGIDTLATFLTSCVFGLWFILRSLHHPDAVLDLTLFRHRSFRSANAATLLYAMGFFAMLLGNVLFLTSVWQEGTLTAGLAITPTPIVVALISGFSGKIATRRGFRLVTVVGSTIFAGGLIYFALRTTSHPSLWTVWLPGTLIVGVGIALTFPVLSAASVADLTSHNLALGGAVNQTARQIGGALGVASLVIVLTGSQVVHGSLTDFHHLWLMSASFIVISGLLASRLPGRRSVQHAESRST
jgi:NTE family protein